MEARDFFMFTETDFADSVKYARLCNADLNHSVVEK